MREILFRGKCMFDGGFVEGFLFKTKEHTYIGYADQYDDDLFISPRNIFIEIDPDTVGQYTGLTDKNGKKIFEGDIVICKQEICGNHIDAHIESGFVEMKHGAFGLHRKQGWYRPFKDWLEDYEYEVIGNIHDNPDLLKGE